jgi:hypothetical protein
MKLLLVKVDGQSGKVTSSEEVDELGGHQMKKHEEKPKDAPKKQE